MHLFLDIDNWPVERNYHDHMKMLADAQNNKGCIREPLLELDSSCCPPDLLHMKKGIISKLVNQLVNWAIVQNRENKLLEEMTKHKIHFR